MAEHMIIHPQLTGAEILWATLAGEGTTTVFGYPGGAILPIYDALRKFPTIHHVLVRHEQGRIHMADGYARASGRVGVCMATSGPGATNLVTGIATAMLDSIPMSPSPARSPPKSSAPTPSRKSTSPASPCPSPSTTSSSPAPKTSPPPSGSPSRSRPPAAPAPSSSTSPRTPSRHRALLLRGRRPARRAPAPHAPGPARAESTSIREALTLIAAAKKPVILAGHGITQSGAEAEVLAFAEALDIPIATTLLGLGAIPAAHPLSLGMMGMHGESWVNHAIQQADLLLAFGMRFDDRVTGNLASYAPNAKKIHIDIDPSEITKNVRADVALIGDLKQILTPLPLIRNWSPSSAQLIETCVGIHHRPPLPLAPRDQRQQRHRRRPRHRQPARQRPPLRRARHQRHLARSRSRRPREQKPSSLQM